MKTDFDEVIERRGTHSQKWDMMEPLFGVSPQDGLPMWVADMDFRPPQIVQNALQTMLDGGVYGYYGDDRGYLSAICWWMKTRHNWTISPEWIMTTHGLVNGTALVIDALTKPGDGVVVMSPVYHAFYKIIHAAGRQVVECELKIENGQYQLDVSQWEAQLQGHERLLILCSPHNPGGRVWTEEELKEIGAFAERHNLLVLSDDIHHDLVYAGETYIPFAKACPEFANRLVTMTATTKTFNIAGGHTGNIIVEDAAIREKIASRILALGISPNSFGMIMAEAAYSAEGAEWLDSLLIYLDQNRALFDKTIDEIPGLQSMRLQATYLAWVSFEKTGMTEAEIQERVQRIANIAPSPGGVFGKGGDNFLRFNIAMPHAYIGEACRRLKKAFKDLQ